MTNEREIEENRNRLDKYMIAKIPVHIVFKLKDEKKVPRFLNGYVTGKRSNDVYIINERKYGETFFLVDDVFSVTVFSKSEDALSEEIIEKSGFKKGEGVMKEDIDKIKEMPDIKKKDKKEPKTNWS